MKTRTFLIYGLSVLSVASCSKQVTTEGVTSSRSTSVSEPSTPTPSPPPSDISKARQYQVAQEDDISVKALERPLSSYTSNEIANLPMNKRFRCKIVVPPDIKPDEVEPTVSSYVNEKILSDPDLDVLAILVYSDPEITEGMYDVATATWAPEGDVGKVTSRIAQSNDRSMYRTKIEIRADLEQYLAQRALDFKKFGLSTDERKQIFKEIISVERQAQQIADGKYSMDSTVPQSKLLENMNMNTDYMRQQKQEGMERLKGERKLTDDQLEAIAIEGLQLSWALE